MAEPISAERLAEIRADYVLILEPKGRTEAHCAAWDRLEDNYAALLAEVDRLRAEAAKAQDTARQWQEMARDYGKALCEESHAKQRLEDDNDRLRAELALALCRGGALEPEPEDGERAAELKAALEARVGRSVRLPLVDVQDPAAEREEKGDG